MSKATSASNRLEGAGQRVSNVHVASHLENQHEARVRTIELQSIVFISLQTDATMFITVDDAKLKIPFPIAVQGEHYWSSVQMRLYNAWFLVGYEICTDETDHRMRATIFVTSAKDVAAIGAAVKVIQVALVTPSWMNQSDSWKMDSLKEMWLGSEPHAKGGGNATVCVTESGTRHVISAIDTPEEEFVSLRRVF